MRKSGHFSSIAAATALAILALTGFLVWKEWRANYLMAEVSVLNTARVLAHQVETSLDQADALLLSLGRRYQTAALQPGPPGPRLAEQLRRELPYTPLLARVGIADAGGFVVFNSSFGPAEIGHLDLSDREYFQRARAGEPGPIFAGPLRMRLTGEWALILARRLEGEGGAFQGVVYGILPVESIGRPFSRIDLGQSGIINLRMLDFAQVVRHPALEGEDRGIGNRNVSKAIRDRILRDPGRDHHVYRATAPLDGVERVYAYQRFDHTPFWMTVGRATADFTSAWRLRTALLAGISLAVACLMLWGARRLGRQNRDLVRRIEEEERAKEGQRESEARYRQLFDKAPVSFWEEDFSAVHARFQELRAEGVEDLRSRLWADPAEVRRFMGLVKIIATNRASLELLGLERMDQLPPTLDAVLPPESSEGFVEELALLYEGRREFELENTLQDARGRRMDVLVRISVLSGPDLSRVLVTTVDLTARKADEAERRRLERELDHFQRLESLGRLAAGLSHDMNNVLGSIMGIATVLKIRHEGEAATARDADTLLRAAVRGRDLVRGLRDFSRKELVGAVDLDLNVLARQEAELLERTTLQKVEIRLDLAPDLPPVHADASAVSSALMNLCMNGLDAMPGGGCLTLATRNLGQGFVELTVTDTGAGMSPAVLARALEPFFTTKPMGKGTGLGLAQVYGAMKAHGGTVDLKSEPGRGTRVSLSFPASATPQPDSPGDPEAGADKPSRPLRVLLVDDDELFRSAARSLLETLGHHVEEARSGPEALARLREEGAVDLVLLDLNMPGMDGAEALGPLQEIRPGQSVLLCTGYADDRVPALLKRFPAVRVLRKPFGLEEIRQAIGQRPAV
ncbi:MAG TPA: response regulator [Holophaga sp.]|nr:response regulator [Holophaga sp.]